MTETVSGTVDRVIFHNEDNGYSVILARIANQRDAVPIVGVSTEPHPGEMIKANGGWTEDRTWGRQFKAESIELVPPSSRDALKDYLASGAVKGIGRSLAKKLIGHFGDRLPEVIERRPERLREIEGIGPRLAERIAEAWKDQASARDTLIFLQKHGINPGTARRIFEQYGGAASDRILADPYILARSVRGVGFATADRLALNLGMDDDAEARLIAGLEHMLNEASSNGHIALDRVRLLERTRDLLGSTLEQLDQALQSALRARLLMLHETDHGSFVFLKALDEAEGNIIEDLDRLAAGKPVARVEGAEKTLSDIETRMKLTLSEEQRKAVLTALEQKLAIITGGPGTGKTTIIRAITETLATVPKINVTLAAPTGRAARRLAASTNSEAWTLHRLLEADPARGFGRNRENPLECDFLVIDEMSMVDVQLFAATLEALPGSAGLLVVGDADQLPSVGPGQVLADLIATGAMPVCSLSQVFRQDSESGIVSNAYRIRQGQSPVYTRSQDQLGDLYGIRAESHEEVHQTLIDLVKDRIPDRFELDPLFDIQIITPTNKGPTGTRELNTLIQSAINPTPTQHIERGGIRYGLGDKVMQLENDYQREVSNGDIGRIIRIDHDAEQLDVEIDNRPVVYGFNELGQLSLAYAITVHKSQGSEYPAVVIVITRHHGRMLQRRLLYTAVTRAQRLVVLLGQQDAISRAIETTDAGRVTLLPWRFAQSRAQETLSHDSTHHTE